MKALLKNLSLLLFLLPLNIAMANEDISGTWQGKLVPAPGMELTIQFVISRNPDGFYSVVLNSPEEGGIKNIEANDVLYEAGALKLDVAELSGSYEGIVSNGSIEGEWKQQGTSMPLNLSPYAKPSLSEEDKEKLLGEWHGDLTIPAGTLVLVFRFEKLKSGDLAGYLDIPDQNANGLPVTDIQRNGKKFVLKVSSIYAEISGELTGSEIIGQFKQGPELLPLTLKKGKYTPPADEYKLSEEDQMILLGEWCGELEVPETPVTPANSVTVVIRFEMSEDGNFKGYTDSPGQGGYDIPITSLEVNGRDIAFKVRSMLSEFNGSFSENAMVGEHKRGPSPLPLTLTKGEYVPPSYSLDLPEEITRLLSGRWNGQLGPLTIVFRFETSEAGDFVAFIDVPNQKAKGIPVTDAGFSDGELFLEVKGISSEFKGQISGNELAGQWIQAGKSNPLTLAKE
jgi:hypothetical protein